MTGEQRVPFSGLGERHLVPWSPCWPWCSGQGHCPHDIQSHTPAGSVPLCGVGRYSASPSRPAGAGLCVPVLPTSPLTSFRQQNKTPYPEPSLLVTHPPRAALTSGSGYVQRESSPSQGNSLERNGPLRDTGCVTLTIHISLPCPHSPPATRNSRVGQAVPSPAWPCPGLRSHCIPRVGGTRGFCRP